MNVEDFQVIIFYKYVTIDNPEEVKFTQLKLWHKFNLKGRMILATEGINGTLEGTRENIQKYLKEIKKDKYFADLFVKFSPGTGKSFPKASIKVRTEIVATHLNKAEDVDPNQTTGKYLTAEQLHQWFESGKKFFIVDMRNDYEQISGHFDGSILSDFRQFYDLPKILPKLEHLKNETLLTVCTAGVRCEKASGFLVKHGFKDVYQLYGGIHTYMQKYPNHKFKGKLYVFDNRLVVGFNRGESEIIGKCFHCQRPSENYVNCSYDFCHYHTIMCEECYFDDGNPYCSKECQSKYYSMKSQKDKGAHFELPAA